MADKDNNKKIVNQLLKNWRDTRALTFDWINSVSVSLLNKKLPRPGLNTFAKQICEMADVETAYAQVLIKSELDFSKTTDGSDIKDRVAKQILRTRLQRSDDFLFKTVNNVRDWNKLIPVFGKNLPKYSVLELITRHETLHQGQFIAYGYLLRVKFPNSWVNAWAIPQQNVKK